ncbi:MAG: CYTH domain-containing protein [Candidatus Riflebacteria bacterium]|nr:CYTH domain-containing protein [Candidatus Riflebacteria bacterium]
MPKEIERKFLVTNDSWKKDVSGISYRQGYISTSSETTVRVRIAGEKAFLTIKGKTTGCSRDEYEYEIPLSDASELLSKYCGSHLVEKIRYKKLINDLTWEIDEFLGENKGLVIVELELPSEDFPFIRPPWTGKEVTGDKRYYNSRLSVCPFNTWT